MHALFSRARGAVNSRAGGMVIAAALAALVTAGALNFQYVNDRITGGPALYDQAAVVAEEVATAVNDGGVASRVEAQAAIGAAAERSGCAVDVSVGVGTSRIYLDARGSQLQALTGDSAYVIVKSSGASVPAGYYIIVFAAFACE